LQQVVVCFTSVVRLLHLSGPGVQAASTSADPARALVGELGGWVWWVQPATQYFIALCCYLGETRYAFVEVTEIRGAGGLSSWYVSQPAELGRKRALRSV
jgi:hypothetical protein